MQKLIIEVVFSVNPPQPVISGVIPFMVSLPSLPDDRVRSSLQVLYAASHFQDIVDG
jgi:hypothetical protein